MIILAGCDSSTSPTSCISSTGSGASGAITPNFTVSYAGAAGRLTGLDPAEAQEQVRDWARLALAAHLRMSTTALRDATYDEAPIRDAGFAGLAQQDIGPGRSLYDDHAGVLHILVPTDDPHEGRTIGIQLDQYRTDAGADPSLVQVHHYQADTATDTITVTSSPAESASQVRAAYHYVTMPIRTIDDLQQFLTRTSYLSGLELRGPDIWASGWDWPATPDARVDITDVSALQQGYRAARAAHDQLPGFSLDPYLVKTTADLLAVVPGLSQDLASRVITGNWTGSPFKSATDLDQIVEGGMTGVIPITQFPQLGLPTDLTQLSALDRQLTGAAAYSQARYDGNLSGTAVGLTLFYADYVAKAWVTGAGTGIPGERATGFVPDTKASTLWSECGQNGASTIGRLWFGENDSAVRSDAKGISIGAQPARMFVRVDGPHGGEVEPYYSFGRAILWWDQHYQAVADYDPEYQRLDQIMRWSDAIDWLVSKTHAALPQVPKDKIPSNLTFKDWYHQHNELRERSPIEFVSPPAARSNTNAGSTEYGESVAFPPSQQISDCGALYLDGGISLSDSSFREGTTNYHPDLPASVRRAGTFDKASFFRDTSGTGDIKQVSLDDTGTVTSFLERRFSTSNGTDVIAVTASGRKVAPFGGLKVWRSSTATRTFQLTIATSQGRVSEKVGVQGQDLGDLEVRDDVDLTTIQWRPGLLDGVRAALEWVQDRLSARPAAGLSAATAGVQADGVLYEYQAPDGQTLYRMAGSGAPWLSITGRGPPAGDDLVFRGGAPNANGSGPDFFYGELVPGPVPDRQWLDVLPARPGQMAIVRTGSAPPSPGARSIRVTTPDGKSTTVYEENQHLLVPDNDPILGLRGSAEGAALLRGFTPVEAAMSAASQAKDNFLRGVVLASDGGADGDGVALADASTVILVAPDHPWASRVQEAVATGFSPTPLIRIKRGQAELVEKDGLTPAGSPSGRTMSFGDVLRMTGQVYVDDEAFRSTLEYHDGPVVTSLLPLDTQVVVLAYTVASSHHIFPDVWATHGGNWVRLTKTPASTSTSQQTQTPTPTPSPTEPPAAVAGNQVLLVSLASASAVAGCGQ